MNKMSSLVRLATSSCAVFCRFFYSTRTTITDVHLSVSVQHWPMKRNANERRYSIFKDVRKPLYGTYNKLSLRRTRSGPAPTVRLREVSALEGDEVND